MTITLLIATTNAGKTREVQAMLDDLPVRLISLAAFPDLESPDETETTLEGNARLKALYYARATKLWTLADDSGLEVDTLDGAPGVHSARYAGIDATDEDNNQKLLGELAGRPDTNRTARFRCCLVLASRDGVAAIASGFVEGKILNERRGHNGFGYDPLFYIEELNQTAAELTPEVKNKISHRGKALEAIRPEIERFLLTGESQ